MSNVRRQVEEICRRAGVPPPDDHDGVELMLRQVTSLNNTLEGIQVAASDACPKHVHRNSLEYEVILCLTALIGETPDGPLKEAAQRTLQRASRAWRSK
jgi:hypothetical protein